MKELTIEEKAKRYDDAIEKARRYYDEYKTRDNILYVEDMEDMFPELKESEDEKIKKEIIDYISKATGCKRWINWLEKHYDKLQDKSALEVINEEKVDNVNKIEPKFKVGDFITNDYCFGKVIAFIDGAYLLDTGQSIPFSCEHNAHLWTIEDAKDGDALADNLGIILFRKIGNAEYKDVIDYYCYTNGRKFKKQKDFEYWGDVIDCALHPATKEQRDLLFAKIKEAGYKWNEIKKELKKIEDEPDVCEGCNNAKGCVACVDGSEWAHIEEKSFWSEEDERMFKSALWHIKNSCGNGGKNSGEFEVYNWFKSLKERVQPQSQWKPSDAQMKALGIAIRCGIQLGTWEEDALKLLKDQLMELKEE